MDKTLILYLIKQRKVIIICRRNSIQQKLLRNIVYEMRSCHLNSIFLSYQLSRGFKEIIPGLDRTDRHRIHRIQINDNPPCQLSRFVL